MIEKQTLDINQEFLSSFSDVKKHLDSLHSDISSIRDSFQTVLDDIKVCKEENAVFMQEVSSLNDKLAVLKMQEREAKHLIERYTCASQTKSETSH